jgi:hypothetical protein
MKGAERGEVAAGAFEREIAADDVNDVAGVADLLKFVFGNETGHA